MHNQYDTVVQNFRPRTCVCGGLSPFESRPYTKRCSKTGFCPMFYQESVWFISSIYWRSDKVDVIYFAPYRYNTNILISGMHELIATQYKPNYTYTNIYMFWSWAMVINYRLANHMFFFLVSHANCYLITFTKFVYRMVIKKPCNQLSCFFFLHYDGFMHFSFLCGS